MRYPEERDTILSRIREVAKKGGTFTRFNLVFGNMGLHHTDDWQECLDYLVKVEELEGEEGSTYSVRKEDTVKDKKYYKGFRVVDGELRSLVDWCGCKVEPEDSYIPEVLTYKEGQITYAPEGTQGIFFEKTLQSAKDLTNSNGGNCHKVVHEVTPLGEQGTGWNQRPICPAVLVGKYVYGFGEPTIQEPEPVPIWADVTNECTVEATRVDGELGVRIHHDRYIVARLCLGNREHEMVGGIGAWEYELRPLLGSWFRVFRRAKK